MAPQDGDYCAIPNDGSIVPDFSTYQKPTAIGSQRQYNGLPIKLPDLRAENGDTGKPMQHQLHPNNETVLPLSSKYEQPNINNSPIQHHGLVTELADLRAFHAMYDMREKQMQRQLNVIEKQQQENARLRVQHKQSSQVRFELSEGIKQLSGAVNQRDGVIARQRQTIGKLEASLARMASHRYQHAPPPLSSKDVTAKYSTIPTCNPFLQQAAAINSVSTCNNMPMAATSTPSNSISQPTFSSNRVELTVARDSAVPACNTSPQQAAATNDFSTIKNMPMAATSNPSSLIPPAAIAMDPIDLTNDNHDGAGRGNAATPHTDSAPEAHSSPTAYPTPTSTTQLSPDNSQGSRKRSYNWMSTPTATNALSKPVKKLKTATKALEKAKGRKKPVKRPEPKKPRQKCSRRSTSKKQRDAEHEESVRLYGREFEMKFGLPKDSVLLPPPQQVAQTNATKQPSSLQSTSILNERIDSRLLEEKQRRADEELDAYYAEDERQKRLAQIQELDDMEETDDESQTSEVPESDDDDIGMVAAFEAEMSQPEAGSGGQEETGIEEEVIQTPVAEKLRGEKKRTQEQERGCRQDEESEESEAE
ncbi:MAG: hypothetical protein Q9170_001062 [Blastenia crenularia]